MKEDDNNVEIRIENACQQDCVGRAVVACVTMDEEEEISSKMTNDHNENDLGINCVI